MRWQCSSKMKAHLQCTRNVTELWRHGSQEKEAVTGAHYSSDNKKKKKALATNQSWQAALIEVRRLLLQGRPRLRTSTVVLYAECVRGWHAGQGSPSERGHTFLATGKTFFFVFLKKEGSTEIARKQDHFSQRCAATLSYPQTSSRETTANCIDTTT